MSLPCIKFFTYTISYLLFILIIIVSSLEDIQTTPQADAILFSDTYSSVFKNYKDYVDNPGIKVRFEVADFYIRDHSPNYLDIAICIYLTGMILRDLKKLILHGVKEYVFSIKNVFNCVCIILFICSFGLKFYTLIKVCGPLIF